MTTQHTPEPLDLILAGPVDEPQIDLVGDYQAGLFCGLEDRGGQGDAYEACVYGFEAGVERALEWAQGLAQEAKDQNRLKLEALEEMKASRNELLTACRAVCKWYMATFPEQMILPRPIVQCAGAVAHTESWDERALDKLQEQDAAGGEGG